MLLRKLTALTAGASVVLIVLSAFAQTNGTTPAHKKKKKKPKHTTSAPAASATIEMDAPPPAAAAPPAASAAPAPAAEPASDKAAPETAPAGDAPASASSDHDTATPARVGHVDVGALVGWGFNGGARFGLGLRGGYTLPMHLYVGATFVYHFGESEFGGTANFFYPGVEVGYELHLGPLLVRPYGGLGPMILHESLPPITQAGVTVAQGSNSKTYFAFWPGAQASYPITPNVFVGVDLRYIFSGYSMFGAFATGGARF